MTSMDLKYLAWLASVTAAFVVGFVTEQRILVAVFGVFVVLTLIHAAVNLASPPTRHEALDLLRRVVDPETEVSILDGEGDYSEWDVFCDTPIINDRVLNSVRVRCHRMSNEKSGHYFRWDDAAKQTYITDAGIEAVEKLIEELEAYAGNR
jgi:hypothetical protein